jgi:hypothetical protein
MEGSVSGEAEQNHQQPQDCRCPHPRFSIAFPEGQAATVWELPKTGKFPVLQKKVKCLALRRGADKSLAFPIVIFAAQPKELFLDRLKKLEQRRHKCVELRGGICRVNTCLQSRSLLFSL